MSKTPNEGICCFLLLKLFYLLQQRVYSSIWGIVCAWAVNPGACFLLWSLMGSSLAETWRAASCFYCALVFSAFPKCVLILTTMICVNVVSLQFWWLLINFILPLCNKLLLEFQEVVPCELEHQKERSSRSYSAYHSLPELIYPYINCIACEIYLWKMFFNVLYVLYLLFYIHLHVL